GGVGGGNFSPRPSGNGTGASRLIRLLSPSRFRLCLLARFLPIAGLTPRRDRMIGPLRSRPITGPSALRRAHPPLCPASVLRPSWVSHLGFSLGIEATGSQVPRSSQDRTRATFMPDATRAVSGSPPLGSRGKDSTPFLTSWLRFRHVISGSLAVAVPIPT